MQEVLLLKCGEIVLKGLNRYKFEERLLRIIRERMKKIGQFDVWSMQSTVYVEPMGEQDMDAAFDAAKKIFGINAVARGAACEKDIEAIKRTAAEYVGDRLDNVRTFKVEAKRSDKRFPLTSPQIGVEVGGYLSDLHPHLKADMSDPQVTITVEVRDKSAYITLDKVRGAGGMPVGSNGRAMLLLSGGIDSPVAGYMMAKRGLEIAAVHFYSYPYTSKEARDKVLELANILTDYTGKITVLLVPFTEIQLAIARNCVEDYFTILMKRRMRIVK